MSGARAAAIYARISMDATGEGLGVQRQLEDCRILAQTSGWTVAEEYVDNDISAYSGKRRPAYERMLADIEAGLRDAVIVYNLDRLTRRPIELEHFRQACEAAGVSLVRSVTSDFDISNDDGLFMARIIAAVAAKESGRKSERVKRSSQQRAERGLPHVQGRRPFGFTKDGMSVVESEAAVLVEVVDRLVAGESLSSAARWLNAQGIATSGGGQWSGSSLRAVVTRASVAGLRSLNGQVVAVGQWPAIISPERREQLLAVLQARAQSGRREPRRYLLSGMLRCGLCGVVLRSKQRAHNMRRYVCISDPAHGGCGHLTVVAEPVEFLVAEMVLFRLDSPQLAQVLSGKASQDEELAVLAQEMATDTERMDTLAQMFAAGEIGRREWLTARKPIEERIAARDRRMIRASGHNALEGLIGAGSDLRASWSSLNLNRQTAIVRALVDHVVIEPADRSRRVFNPERVQPVWRL